MQVINRSMDQLHLSSTVYISTFNGEPKPKHEINISEPLWEKRMGKLHMVHRQAEPNKEEQKQKKLTEAGNGEVSPDKIVSLKWEPSTASIRTTRELQGAMKHRRHHRETGLLDHALTFPETIVLPFIV